MQPVWYNPIRASTRKTGNVKNPREISLRKLTDEECISAVKDVLNGNGGCST